MTQCYTMGGWLLWRGGILVAFKVRTNEFFSLILFLSLCLTFQSSANVSTFHYITTSEYSYFCFLFIFYSFYFFSYFSINSSIYFIQLYFEVFKLKDLIHSNEMYILFIPKYIYIFFFFSLYCISFVGKRVKWRASHKFQPIFVESLWKFNSPSVFPIAFTIPILYLYF